MSTVLMNLSQDDCSRENQTFFQRSFYHKIFLMCRMHEEEVSIQKEKI